MSRITLVVADRYPLFLIGLASIFRATDIFQIVASCSSGTNCIEAIRNLNPEIAIVDSSLLKVTVAEMLSLVDAERLRTRFVVLTTSAELEMMPGVTGKAHAILPRDIHPDILVRTIARVASGHRSEPKVVPDRDKEAVDGNPLAAASGLATLTDRERQIMTLVSKGLSNKEIGRQLNISDGTIKVHLHNIYQKLDVGNRTLLAALALSEGK
ncbi:MAG: two-component response regulator [Tardiphaga sp.]|jgi:two-component system nitrate/nitrite response regulator NarL|nr:two-component response regulator [Tardiphaga sp.]